MPDVYWLIPAQRRFCEAMPPGLPTRCFCAQYVGVCQVLAQTFPKAAAVIVRDRLCGYRNRSDQHVLLVEVVHRTQGLSGADPGITTSVGQTGWPDFCGIELGDVTSTTGHVVKVAEKEELLKRELEAWEGVRPVGMTHDSILMRLRPGARGGGSPPSVRSIVYEDAHHVIGAGTVLSLEQAMLDCCRWGTPTLTSLQLVLKCLYERLGADFYNRSAVLELPEDNWRKFSEWKNVRRWLELFQDKIALGEQQQLDLLRIRREILGFLSCKLGQPIGFLDPADYLRSVAERPDVCPLLLWGCSHGDLHGRNVLVTVTEDDANLPAVFDYEEMGRENLIGWDFVKLETEIKVRVLSLVFAGPETPYLEQVVALEQYLAERTQAMHDQQANHEEFHGPDSLKRLAALVLTIRSEARRHLGLQRLRDRQWLEEYYFLLACYGLNAARFDTYRGLRRQIIAAYVSAGVAAALLSRPYQQLGEQIRAMEATAERLLGKPSPGNGPERIWPSRMEGEISHHGRLSFVRVWTRSRNPDLVKTATDLLCELRADFPHVLEIEEELALAYLELKDYERAEELLRGVSLRYGHISEEMLCRFGRLWKNKGEDVWEDDSQDALRFFNQALRWYRKAFEVRGDYYPGINVATLLLLLGRRTEATSVAEVVLSSVDGGDGPAELAWIRATRGEACLLLGNSIEAEACYRQAMAQSNAHARATMRSQAKMIVQCSAKEVQDWWTSQKFDEVFG